VPPAEPPPKRTAPVSRRSASTRSFVVFSGERAGTARTSASVVSVAIGVTWSIETGERFVSIAPSITRPMTMSWYGSPSAFETSCESPSVPPAPPTLKTSAPPCSANDSRIVDCRARAVESQPPPGSAGAMIEIRRSG
jgi:hypothetical protein